MSSPGLLTILPLVLLLSGFHQAEGQCKTFRNYYVLGRVESSPVTESKCDYNDTCTYVSMDIPALAVGSFSGCSGDVHMRLVVQVLARRRDLRDSVEDFLKKNGMSLGFPKFSKLQKYGDQLHTFDTISGPAKIFLHFYEQGEDYPYPAVRFEGPTLNATSVQCTTDGLGLGLGKKECYEGYCSFAEFASVSRDGKSQVSKKIQACPNELYEELYMLSKGIVPSNFSQALLNDLTTVAHTCTQKNTHTYLSKGGLSSYYWHVDCSVPVHRIRASHVPQFIFHTPHQYFSFPVYKDDEW
uniref:CUB domain-containing protein n=1 Tax=Strongyloides papillosus TaxID=174720 RepID=A0A0N5C4M0_STREA